MSDQDCFPPSTFNILRRSLAPWNPFVRENIPEGEIKRAGSSRLRQDAEKEFQTWKPKSRLSCVNVTLNKAGATVLFFHFAKKNWPLRYPAGTHPTCVYVNMYIRRPDKRSKNRAADFLVKNVCQKFAGSQFPREFCSKVGPASFFYVCSSIDWGARHDCLPITDCCDDNPPMPKEREQKSTKNCFISNTKIGNY